MHDRQGIKSIVIERKIIRADGRQRPGDENRVCSVWHEDPEVMERMLAPGGALAQADGTVTPKAALVGRVTPSDLLLSLTPEELEGGRP